MKKKVLSLLLTLCLVMTFVPMAAFAEDAIGAAQSSRTVITTVDELMQFAADVNAGAYDGKTDAVVSLESDLDLSGKTWTSIGCADNDANVPHFFSGKFYGNGHTISNLDFSDAYGMIEYESYGFFGYIENAEISGLTVQGSVNATGSRKYSDFGSIVGASIKSTIRDCVSDISFTNSENYLDGSIGLCGVAMDSTFEHCQSKGSISVTRTDNGVASLNVGGIVGYAGGTSEIRYCVNTADIEVCANSIGGIAGYLGSGNPSITNCYSIGKLTVLGKPSGGNTGGIVGHIYGDTPIKNCYFAGEIDLTNYGVTTPPYNRLGGLVGKVESGTPVFKNNYYTATENVASCGTSTFAAGTAAAGTAESIDSMKTQEFYDKLTRNGGDYRFNPNGTPLLPGPKYTVTFTVFPAELTNVVITANGQTLTNGSIDLEAGVYPVTVTADNCEPFSADITITADTATHAQTLTLTYKPADYTKVDAAIAKANALNKDNYKDFSAVETAVNAVVRDKNITEQSAVDAMAKAIEDAIAALQYKDADYTKVDAALAKANALNKDNYKDFSAVETAVNAVARGKNITQQAEVDAMAKAIEDAITALQYKDADYTRVDAAIARANALNKNDYKDFSGVECAIRAVARGKNITQQAEVDAMAKAIEDALAALQYKDANKTTQPTPAPAATATPQYTIPQTGDTSNPALLVVLMLVSGSAAIGTAVVASKRKNNR